MPIRPMNTTELSQHYGVSRPTIRKWIDSIKEEVGQRVGYIYTPKQVEIIHLRLKGKININ